MDSKAEHPFENLALIVDGKALLQLTKAMDDKDAGPDVHELMMDFITVARNCKAVICCRVSPDQKRQVPHALPPILRCCQCCCLLPCRPSSVSCCLG